MHSVKRDKEREAKGAKILRELLDAKQNYIEELDLVFNVSNLWGYQRN